jgi:hypothetical protein
MVLGLVAPAFGTVIFQDDFEGETQGEPPQQWTSSIPGGDFFVSNEGGPYHFVMYTHFYNGNPQETTPYTLNSVPTFTPTQITNWWTFDCDIKYNNEYAPYSYIDVLRTPGNFRLEKDSYRKVNVYDGNGTLLGTTNNELTSGDGVWTHYFVEYKNGSLTVTLTNSNGATTGTFTGTSPDFNAFNKIALGALGYTGGNYTRVDNVVMSTVPEPATLSLLGLAILGILRRK